MTVIWKLSNNANKIWMMLGNFGFNHEGFNYTRQEIITIITMLLTRRRRLDHMDVKSFRMD